MNLKYSFNSGEVKIFFFSNNSNCFSDRVPWKILNSSRAPDKVCVGINETSSPVSTSAPPIKLWTEPEPITRGEVLKSIKPKSAILEDEAIKFLLIKSFRLLLLVPRLNSVYIWLNFPFVSSADDEMAKEAEQTPNNKLQVDVEEDWERASVIPWFEPESFWKIIWLSLVCAGTKRWNSVENDLNSGSRIWEASLFLESVENSLPAKSLTTICVPSFWEKLCAGSSSTCVPEKNK